MRHKWEIASKYRAKCTQCECYREGNVNPLYKWPDGSVHTSAENCDAVIDATIGKQYSTDHEERTRRKQSDAAEEG